MKKHSQTKKTIDKNKMYLVLGGILLLFTIFLLVYLKAFKANGEEYVPYYEIEEKEKQIEETQVAGQNAVGWLRVQGTNIDTPIVYWNDTLTHAGALSNYLWNSEQYEEGENRKVIYGHNILNVSNDPDVANPEHIRFEQLMSFMDYDFAKTNLYIQYNDGKEEALYKIYAVGFDDIDSEKGQSYPQKELSSYIKTVKKNSIYKYQVDVNDSDTLLSLVTCTRYFGAQEKTQFRVDARKLRKNEKIRQYKVEFGPNYDIIK